MIQRDPSLLLHEEIMLLALREEQGTVIAGPMYCYALGGALLAELLLAKRIRVADDRKRLVDWMDPAPLGDSLLDECLERIRSAKRRASFKTWLSRFAQMKQLKHRVAGQLCERGILRADQDKVLLIFKRRVYPEIDPRPERAVIERLERAIFAETDDVDPRTATLIALANSADVLKVPFDKKKLRKRKARIEQITSGNVLGDAAKEAVEAARATAAMVAIMPAIAVTAVACH